MEISVNSEWLDMPLDAAASMHWSGQRFSDVFADEFSTDFELPRTAKNIRLLDVWSVLARQGEPFGNMVPCVAVMRGWQGDGALSIDGMTADGIKVTLYARGLPESLKGDLRDIVTDTNETIIDFTTTQLEQSGSADAVNRTLYADRVAVVRPNVRVQWILSQIADKTGVAMPTVDADMRIVATRQVVCPQNAVQVFDATWGDTSGEWLRTGQHITNEVSSEGVTVQMNRAATVQVSAWVHTAIVSGTAVVAIQASEDGSTWMTRLLQSGGVGTTTHTTIQMSTTANTQWRIQCSGWQGRIVLVCRWANYTITADDYDTALKYDRNGNYTLPSWVGEKASFVYFGTIANLPTFTVRQLLSSLAWQSGQRIEVQPSAVTLSPATRSAEIEGEISAVNFACSALGQRTVVEAANGDTLAEVQIPNASLESVKTVHKSIFAKLQSVDASNYAYIHLYDLDESGAAVPVTFEGVALARAVAFSSGTLSGTVRLVPYAAWSTLGLDELHRVCEVQGVTDADISALDFVTLHGYRLMLIEGDRDELSGLTNFKSLLI